MGVKMLEMPKRGLPFLRGRYQAVSGMDGGAFITDGTYENIEVSFSFDVTDRDSVPAVDAWLAGAGPLIFSDEPDRAYDARLNKAFNRRAISKRLDGQRYAVAFTCAPFKRQYPAPEAIELTAAGTIVNPGSAPSQPRVTIAGSGDFSVTIGLETLFFSDVSGGGIIVDSELMDAFSYDGTELANDHFSGQPFQILPGSNNVSWTVEDGSSISKITILPRWRWR